MINPRLDAELVPDPELALEAPLELLLSELGGRPEDWLLLGELAPELLDEPGEAELLEPELDPLSLEGCWLEELDSELERDELGLLLASLLGVTDELDSWLEDGLLDSLDGWRLEDGLLAPLDVIELADDDSLDELLELSLDGSLLADDVADELSLLGEDGPLDELLDSWLDSLLDWPLEDELLSRLEDCWLEPVDDSWLELASLDDCEEAPELDCPEPLEDDSLLLVRLDDPLLPSLEEPAEPDDAPELDDDSLELAPLEMEELDGVASIGGQ